MANFDKDGKNVHGLTLRVPFGTAFYEIGLWGPIDIRTMTELKVAPTPPNASIDIKDMGMKKGSEPVRTYRLANLPIGKTVFEARDSGNIPWTQVTIEVPEPPASQWVVTRSSLLDAAGVVQARWPPSPAIQALIRLMTRGTGELRAGMHMLESAGRSGNLYEHTSGLALDIFRLKSVESQRRQAHNLIRFFVRNRNELGWRNMFYESWGFARSGTQNPSENHDDHIHIDWMDFSTLKFDGGNKWDRSKWTEITWPLEARSGSAIDSDANAAAVKSAWTDTSTELLTEESLKGLYT